MIGHVDLTGLAGPEAESWREILLLSQRYQRSWCIVGAQMVTLHALVHGASRPLRTRDLDVLVDIRALRTQEVSEFLVERGFDLESVGPNHVGHRFIRDRISIDVLSIDNVGDRADKTTLPPAHTVEVPGGRQAIEHLDEVGVTIDGASGDVPIPDWAGALLLKARAAMSLKDSRAKHLQDVAVLLGLPIELESLVASLTLKERRYVTAAIEMLDDTIWRAVAGAVDQLEAKAAANYIRQGR